MDALNRVELIGVISSDLELKQTANAKYFISFSIATANKYTDKDGNVKESTDFHLTVAWGKLAEEIGRFCKKGDRLYIEGELKTRSWEGQDGKKGYKTEVNIKNIIRFALEQMSIDDIEGEVKKMKPKLKQEEISIEDIPF